MKNISKIGLSALCGTLAATSAYAGAMDVTGNAHATWTSKEKAVSGNPLGMKSNLSFKGSGELDNGMDFSVTLAHNDQNAWSSGNITLNTAGIGSFKLSAAEGGNGIGGYDDNMPRAWEEAWDTGAGTGADLAKGVGSSTNIMWTLPTVAGATLKLAWAPKNDGTQPNDKAVGGDNNTYKQSGIDAVLDISPEMIEGLNLFVGGSRTERDGGQVTTKKANNDHEEVVGGLSFALGPVKVGIQKSGEFTGSNVSSQVEYYVNTSWGISFNVSDNLSLSYGYFQSKKDLVNDGTGTQDDLEVESVQAAYTMGGLALKIAETQTTNSAYGSAAGNDYDTTTVSMSMAF